MYSTLQCSSDKNKQIITLGLCLGKGRLLRSKLAPPFVHTVACAQRGLRSMKKGADEICAVSAGMHQSIAFYL